MIEHCGCRGLGDVFPFRGGMRVSCCSCGALGPLADTVEDAIAAWNRAMGKDLRDAVDEWIARRNGSHGCEPYHDVCDRLEAARKGAK